MATAQTPPPSRALPTSAYEAISPRKRTMIKAKCADNVALQVVDPFGSPAFKTSSEHEAIRVVFHSSWESRECFLPVALQENLARETGSFSSFGPRGINDRFGGSSGLCAIASKLAVRYAYVRRHR